MKPSGACSKMVADTSHCHKRLGMRMWLRVLGYHMEEELSHATWGGWRLWRLGVLDGGCWDYREAWIGKWCW